MFDNDPPVWQTWLIPAAGLFASLLILFTGRLVLSRRRAAARRQAEAADAPHHDPFDLGSVTERRGTVRRKGSPIELTIRNDQPEGEPDRTLGDRSLDGGAVPAAA